MNQHTSSGTLLDDIGLQHANSLEGSAGHSTWPGSPTPTRPPAGCPGLWSWPGLGVPQALVVPAPCPRASAWSPALHRCGTSTWLAGAALARGSPFLRAQGPAHSRTRVSPIQGLYQSRSPVATPDGAHMGQPPAPSKCRPFPPTPAHPAAHKEWGRHCSKGNIEPTLTF